MVAFCIDVMENKITHQDCILAMGDSTTHNGMVKKKKLQGKKQRRQGLGCQKRSGKKISHHYSGFGSSVVL